MAGIMNSDCQTVRHELAELLLLRLPLPDATDRHLTTCSECSHEAAEIRSVVRTLHRAAPPPAPAIKSGPASELRQHRRDVSRAAGRRAPRRRIVTGGAAALLAAAAACFVPGTVLGHGPAGPPTAVALTREGRMVTQPWGTEVPVALTGLLPGRTYRLMTEDSYGHRLPGGSVRTATDAMLHTRISTAMSRAAIAALLVEDESGRVVGSVKVVPWQAPSSSPLLPS